MKTRVEAAARGVYRWLSMKRSLSRRCLYAWLVLCAGGPQLVASAQAAPSAGNSSQNSADAASRERARALATQGYEALQAKDFRAAEDLFRRADALVHAPTIVVDHARALVGLGRLVEAHERYEQVLREGIPKDAPLSWRRAAQDAEDELDAIQPRLAWLTLVVHGPAKPAVYLDGRRVPIAALGVRRASDPGARALRIAASGYEPVQQTIQLKEGETRTLEITLQRSSGAELPLEEEETRQGAPAPARAPEAPPSSPAVYVALGLGGVGVLSGTVAGMLALNTRSALKLDCPDRSCVPSSDEQLRNYQDRVDRYRLWGSVSGVSFAIGAAALATSGVLFLLGDSEQGARSAGQRFASKRHDRGRSAGQRPAKIGSAESASARIHPYLSGRELGIFGTF